MSTRRNATSTNGARTFFAAILGLLAAIATIVTPLGVWMKYEVSDTDSFVEATAPLASDLETRKALTDDVKGALPEAITSLGGGLVDNLIATAMDKVMSTPAFERAWAGSIREAHTQGISILEGKAANDDGTVALQLGPLINSVKESMVESGVPAAQYIPEVQTQLTIAPTSKFVQAQEGYRLAMFFGTWGPAISIALWALVILVAPRRGAAIGWLGFIGMLAAGLSYVALNVGGTAVQSALSGSQLPTSVATAAYAAVASEAHRGLIILAVAGLVVLIVGAIIGRKESS